MIPAEAVEAAMNAWLERSGKPGAWSLEEEVRTILEAAAPYMQAEDRAAVWAEGHEAGFWNGRMSSGDTAGVPLIGKAHADATNPYMLNNEGEK